LTDDALEEVNRWWTVARAFSNTAHAVNNALQVVSGNAELLESAGGLDPAALRRVHAIHTQAGRAAVSVEGLLAYARATSQSPAALDLARILDAVVEMRSHSLSRARIIVEVSRPDDGSCIVWAPAGKLVQLLLNLLLMVEAHAAGSAEARMHISIERLPSQVRLLVVASGGPASPVGSPSPDWFLGFEKRAQERVVEHLTAGIGGRLSFERSTADVGRIELTLAVDHRQP
jgi:signal transduction histidine kinase